MNLHTDARWRKFVALLALAAALWSGYLLWSTLTTGAVAGCGAGSGCASVMATSWSRWLGVPVSAGAVAVYGVMALLLGLGAGRAWTWAPLWALAVTALGSAGWFIWVQQGVVHATCVYCMWTHTVGGLAALLVVLTAPRPCGWRWRGAVGAGVLAVAVLAGGQVWFPSTSQTRVYRTGDVQDTDTGPAAGAARQITIMNGHVRLRPYEFPCLGSPAAPYVMVAMVDYTCGYCRIMHRFAEEVRQRHPDQVAIVVLPVPMWPDCNPAIHGRQEIHQDACTLAKLALAVWYVRPEAFAEYDHWLFASARPRPADEALVKARELVGAANLDRALADPWPTEQLRHCTEMFAVTGIGRLPALAAGSMLILGLPGKVEELEADLYTQWPALQPTATAPAP